MDEFKNIVVELKQGLFRYARRLTGNYEDSEDIVQEAFIKIWNKWDSLDKARIHYYAYFITRNLCIDKLRSKQYKHRTIDLGKIDYELISSEKSPEFLAEISGARELINRIILSFPENWQTIFHLCDIEGLSYDEVAEILKINQSTLRVNLSRIRKRIKEELERKYGYRYERQ